MGYTQLVVTGRSDEIRKLTEDWLLNNGVFFDRLYMRKEGDYREDSIVKSEILDQIKKDYNMDLHSIGGVFEDRDQVVKMYRDRGLRVFQVAEGRF